MAIFNAENDDKAYDKAFLNHWILGIKARY